LCGEDAELLSEGGIGIEGKSRLSFAHHANHFDAGQDGGGGFERFEAEHWSYTARDPPMVLSPLLQSARIGVTALHNQDMTRHRGAINRADFRKLLRKHSRGYPAKC
jgi:hypothetical protein